MKFSTVLLLRAAMAPLVATLSTISTFTSAGQFCYVVSRSRTSDTSNSIASEDIASTTSTAAETMTSMGSVTSETTTSISIEISDTVTSETSSSFDTATSETAASTTSIEATTTEQPSATSESTDITMEVSTSVDSTVTEPSTTNTVETSTGVDSTTTEPLVTSTTETLTTADSVTTIESSTTTLVASPTLGPPCQQTQQAIQDPSFSLRDGTWTFENGDIIQESPPFVARTPSYLAKFVQYRGIGDAATMTQYIQNLVVGATYYFNGYYKGFSLADDLTACLLTVNIGGATIITRELVIGHDSYLPFSTDWVAEAENADLTISVTCYVGGSTGGDSYVSLDDITLEGGCVL